MIRKTKITKDSVTVTWSWVEGADRYLVYWSDRDTKEEYFRRMEEIPAEGFREYTLKKSTQRSHYLRICAMAGEQKIQEETYITPVCITAVFECQEEQLEQLDRGLVAVKTKEGIFLSWRLFLQETVRVSPEKTGLEGTDFVVYRNGKAIAAVTDSTNYLDREGTADDFYAVADVVDGKEGAPCEAVHPWEKPYLDIPIQKPEGGVTPAGEAYEYSANDMSVADVDGDGACEYIVKWDPSNSHDVSVKGYTGRCFLDCYKLDGRLLWRLDMGENIRAGAHYTQFMCYDFNGDGKAEMAVKTAPGTKMTRYGADGSVLQEGYITMPEEDLKHGYSHEDSYVCSRESYYRHLVNVFAKWQDHPEVTAGHWPKTLEACFGLEELYDYPLKQADAEALVDYFLDVYAPSRSSKNKLWEFEGFIYEGPEYLTMFSGDGQELETIPFPFGRVDDGLMWGDYASNRMEPCNRVDRFLSGVAYLDGKRPYLIICRGYYTRTAMRAYGFFDGHFEVEWSVDSGFVPMENPFCDSSFGKTGTDPVYGELAGQGNHSLSTADIDGDGCMEVIYGAACIDHDGSLLYSSKGRLPDGRETRLGHGDAMHVADIDPRRPGLEIFQVFEGAEYAPYGYALREAENGEVIFGEYADKDLGRCMIGDMVPGVKGLQCWVNHTGLYDCEGHLLSKETPGSNMSIRWAADLSTQITDGADYLNQKPTGVINDMIHGTMLVPEDTLTNNGTKGNPCLVADIFGDFREEILLRTKDSRAIRIYTNTELTRHKLFTLMHDAQYRCGVAWQNNCYNQPCYTKFYYASDMDFEEVLPVLKQKPVIWLAGDSITQSYKQEARPQTGWGEHLLECLDSGSYIREQRADCPFDQEMRYEGHHMIVDNCAVAGRSSRTFREEGRLDDIQAHIKEGDYLFIQFGHNDASSSKLERYVPIETFARSLMPFIQAAKSCGAVPVLISSIALCPCEDTRTGEKGEIAKKLPEYGAVMKQLAKEEKIPFIDMGKLTKMFMERQEKPEEFYMPDHVHLSPVGAKNYAGLLAEEFKQILRKGGWGR